MELYIVRHGKTVWNKDNRLQGTHDIDLTEEGKDAAQKLGEALKNISFDVIYSSPLKRAFETANLIFKNREIKIITDERLTEIDFGFWEGKTYEELEGSDHPSRNFFKNPGQYQPKDGETLQSLCERTKNFIQEVIENQYGSASRLMIVAHGALNKGIMCYLDNHGTDEFWKDGLQKNCEASIYDFDGKKWRKVK